MSTNVFERISVKQFGILNDGREVQVFTLRNSQGASIRILDLGGMLMSINTLDREGNIADIVLGFDSPQSYLTTSPYMGALIGRYANRIAKGRFTLDGHEYTLAINNDENALHGGVVGFDKQIWKSSFSSTSDYAQLNLSLLSKDGEEGYPGNVSVNVVYTFDEKNRLTIDYLATTDKATVVNLTNHVYFNLNGHNAGAILDHQLMINADHFTPIDSTSIPTGELAAVAGTPFDFRIFKSIGQDIDDYHQQLKNGNGFDHNWVLKKSNGKGLELAAIVHSPVSGRIISVYTDQPGIQFYTGNFLDGGFSAKDGAIYQQRNAFCLETQHFPDSPNQENFPTTVLRPGEQYKTKTIFEFGTKK